MSEKKQISKIANAIALRVQKADGVSYENWIYHQIPNIKAIVPVFQLGFKEILSDGTPTRRYDYEDKMMIQLSFASGANQFTETFDIQDILNQPGWTHDEAGFIQAMTDINAWCASSSGGGLTDAELRASPLEVEIVPGSGNETPDVIDLSAESFPYAFPDSTYTSANLVINSGTTIEFNGIVLTEGTYGFASQNGSVGSFTLDNPSPGTPDAFILVMS